jgi:proteasome assembly chaperone 3
MLTQKQSSKVINGINTEVVLQPFADRILILITQLGKVGNLVRL